MPTLRHSKREQLTVNPLFTEPGETERLPRHRLREDEMDPRVAYEIVSDEAMLDGNVRQNLATFVTTWMEGLARKLYTDTLDKNMIDKDEYPQTAAIEDRCVRILASLWHSPDPAETVGVSTVGSSEACMLAGLALKRRWQLARRSAGRPADRPNIVFSSAVQVVWEKFANYWDVEARHVPITDREPYLSPSSLADHVDENTIGVVPTMGVTYTGLYEPVARIASALDDLQKRTGLDVPIHVDAASGGFVAPFLQPDVRWDFRLPRVHSINTSGHKYGLVYPGLGWVVWRRPDYVPDELIFKVAYLGGSTPTFGLNFSRPGSQVLLQYYNFLRLGRIGYTRVQQQCQNVATFLSTGIAKLDAFDLITDGTDLPVFAWRLRDGHTGAWDLYDLSNKLREKGWQVPAYPLPANLTGTTVMRIVVRNGLSMDLADLFLADLADAVAYLDRLESPMPRRGRCDTAFHH